MMISEKSTFQVILFMVSEQTVPLPPIINIKSSPFERLRVNGGRNANILFRSISRQNA